MGYDIFSRKKSRTSPKGRDKQLDATVVSSGIYYNRQYRRGGSYEYQFCVYLRVFVFVVFYSCVRTSHLLLVHFHLIFLEARCRFRLVVMYPHVPSTFTPPNGMSCHGQSYNHTVYCEDDKVALAR